MTEKKLKVIVLTHGGADRLLELLAAIETVEIAGVFIETVVDARRNLKQKLARSVRYDGYLATFKKFFKSNDGGDLESVLAMQNGLEKTAETLGIPVHKVENFHTEDSINLLRAEQADLGILYGTNIIKESVFGIPRLGSINIHQGLAPFYRGGPPVFWELFNGEKEVGVTVHFVAPKVDTGDIILQKTFPLEYDFAQFGLNYEYFLERFRASLKEPSAQMLAEAVQLIAEGKAPRTKQDASLGKRYRLPIKSEKDALLRLLKKRSEFTL
jgi:folate-dependent phosphoribosylglycinamide formyltransferase PurN